MLEEASAAGGTKLVKILLQHVVAHDETALVHEDLGRACLCRSVAKGHVEVVKVLLEVGGAIWRCWWRTMESDGGTWWRWHIEIKNKLS